MVEVKIGRWLADDDHDGQLVSCSARLGISVGVVVERRGGGWKLWGHEAAAVVFTLLWLDQLVESGRGVAGDTTVGIPLRRPPPGHPRCLQCSAVADAQPQHPHVAKHLLTCFFFSG